MYKAKLTDTQHQSLVTSIESIGKERILEILDGANSANRQTTEKILSLLPDKYGLDRDSYATISRALRDANMVTRAVRKQVISNTSDTSSLEPDYKTLYLELMADIGKLPDSAKEELKSVVRARVEAEVKLNMEAEIERRMKAQGL